MGLPVCSKSRLVPLQLLALSGRDLLPEAMWEGPFEVGYKPVSALGQNSLLVEQPCSVLTE